jgi:hypothetical protein
VTLEVNRAIEGAEGLMRGDAKTAGMIYPAAAREILTRILVIDRHEFDSDGDEWPDLWIKWAASLAPDPLPEGDDDGEKLGWIEEVVRAFAARHEFATRFHATEEAAES